MVKLADETDFLVVKELRKYFPLGRPFLMTRGSAVRAVDGVSFVVGRGQVLGLVGESGCGKTTAGRAILRLIEPSGGQVFFDGQDVTKANAKELKTIRRRIQFVFQDPFSSLDPRMSVYRILKEPLDNFVGHLNRRKKRDLVPASLIRIGLQADHMNRFPHEFSGGQRQRIALARALICGPELVICDEPVSALDVSIQAQVINLLKRLQRELNLSLIFISHDLAVVEHICDTVAVMYLGRIVEISPSTKLYREPIHPYTRALLSAVPIPDPVLEKKRKTEILAGEVPSPIDTPPGCQFHPRCPLAVDECGKVRPNLVEVTPGHMAACLRRDAAKKAH